jgi:hypothetical protein
VLACFVAGDDAFDLLRLAFDLVDDLAHVRSPLRLSVYETK